MTLPLDRMLSISKSSYRTEHPDNVTVFNANIFTRTKGKVWHGDLDITLDGDELRAMAAERGEVLYIFRERDGRFDHETDPVWEAAVARVSADAVSVY